MALQNIILDLGGVIIDLDYNRTADAFKALGISNFDEIYSQAKQSSLFDDFETGRIGQSQFREGIRSWLAKDVSDLQLDAAWNAMLLGIPLHRMEFIRSLRRHHRVFLLSNTNKIHVEAFMAMAVQFFGEGYFESSFERIYLSCEMGMRKPDVEIFEFVIQENQLNKQETLFVDDSHQHIVGAQTAGIRAEWLDLKKGELLEEKYKGLLL